MAVLVNQESGLAEDLPQGQADQALASGTHSIPLNDEQGNPVTASPGDVNALLSKGHTQPSTEQLKSLLDNAKYSSTEQQVKAGIEGGAQGLIGPAAPYIEKNLFGVKPEDIRGREETNPGIHSASEVGGLIGGSLVGTGEGALLSHIGEGTANLAGLGEATTWGGKVAAGAVRGAAENLAYQGGDETSKLITQDPNQATETAVGGHLGLAAVIGGVTGGAFGALSPLWKMANESKVGQFIEDFKGQMKNRMENPNPSEALTNELTDHYNNTKAMADEVYGQNGLKAQAVEKSLPEMGPKISDQVSKISDDMDKGIAKLEADGDPLAAKLRKSVDEYKNKISSEVDPLTLRATKSPTPSDIFNAAQDLKQQLQEYGQYNKTFTPLAEKDFRLKAKELAFSLRNDLENPEVWGKAANAQKDINGAFKEYLPSLKDFEKKFTVEVGGEKVIDPGKVQTYVNQAGKDAQKIKQEMLGNFLDASDKYRGVIDKTHASLGSASPYKASSLSSAKASLQYMTAGAKAADTLINKGLANVGGKTIGAGVGGALGHFVGSPGMGALIGEHALGPMFSSVLPSLVKPILENASNPGALKNAIDLGMSVVKGEHLINRAAGSLFSSSGKIMPDFIAPSVASREKLKNRLDSLTADSSPLLDTGAETGHYLPEHGSALGGIAARSTQYLQGLKPSTAKAGPLDPPRVPSKVETSKYDRAIDVAQQPLLAVQSIKDGSLTPEDVQTVKAIYPNLYARLCQKMTEEMINHVSKGNDVPYKTRLGLSLFTGQNLDSTMTPQAILSAQPTSAQVQAQAQGSEHSMNSLNKIAGMSQTPIQAREASRLKA